MCHSELDGDGGMAPMHGCPVLPRAKKPTSKTPTSVKLPPSNLRGQGWPAAEDTCWTASINHSPAKGRCLDRPARPRGATLELVLHALQAQVHTQVMQTCQMNGTLTILNPRNLSHFVRHGLNVAQGMRSTVRWSQQEPCCTTC
jgi:hypothetical protein